MDDETMVSEASCEVAAGGCRWDSTPLNHPWSTQSSARTTSHIASEPIPPIRQLATASLQILLSVLALLLAEAALASAVDAPPAFIPAGSFDSVLPQSEATKRVHVEAFRLDRTPVTNAQFARFVRKDPSWQRDRVARLFADEQYLRHWPSAAASLAADANKPVTHVSWFAASAYCEARGARLTTWHEWEYAAAASTTDRDARDDPQWRQQILSWYSQSARGDLAKVGNTPANVYGVHDLHGLVWEWIDDLPSLLVANDSREQGDPNDMRFCGAAAVTMEQKENYAMLMRIAMLSSMKASYTSSTMGFRCATDVETKR